MAITEAGSANLDFDPTKLREKYLKERAKRVREEGKDQYQKLEGRFAHFNDDPYVKPGFKRDPIVEDVDVMVIGGGYSGVLCGVELRKAGIDNFRILDFGGDFGGTWYWNRYPGCACDVESYIYLPMLEEMGYVPPRNYATASQIWEHLKSIARKYDLYKGAMFQTRIVDVTWDNEIEKYIVKTDRNDVIRARYVVSASGMMARPKLPGIPGIESYKGHAFHTSRWDYDYTGGDSSGGLNKLNDKRVAIIGTGATAIQAIPHLAAGAKELIVFQRTPSSIHVRNEHDTDTEWFKNQPKGWYRERVENFTTVFHGGEVEEDLVNDSWTKTFFDAAQTSSADSDVPPQQMANYKIMQEARAQIDAIIKDPETAEKLKPWYNFFCKRPCFHDEYLEVYNRANVSLVDVSETPIDRIDETGLWVGDMHYEVDCIVFSTGFEVGTSYKSRCGFDVHGRGGVTLDEHWEDGFRSLHGIMMNKFPNFFMMGSTYQTTLTANIGHILMEQAEHIGAVFKKLSKNCTQTIEVSKEGEESWIAHIVDLVTKNAIGAQNFEFQQECTPGYYNNEGRPDEVPLQSAPHGLGPVGYFGDLKQWREEGMPGLKVTPAPVSSPVAAKSS